MKKLILAIALCLVCAVSFGQNNNHFTFKGVDMGKNKSEFVRELISKGYKYHTLNGSIEHEGYLLDGEFAGYDCGMIGVYCSGNDVWKIVLWLDPRTDWYSLKSQYNTLKDAYITKYGEPSGDFHFFKSPYDEGDGYEALAVKSDKCRYYTIWELSNGSISLEITNDMEVKIVYEDAQNTKKRFDEQKNKRISDI